MNYEKEYTKHNVSVVDLIGCMSIGVDRFLGQEVNFPVSWWERALLRFVIKKRGLGVALCYAQKAALDRYYYDAQILGMGKK